MKTPNPSYRFLTGSKGRLSLPISRWTSAPTVLVEPAEFDAYRDQHPKLNIWAMERDGAGFGYLLNYMVDHTLKHGSRYLVFADDYLLGLRLRPRIGTKWKTVKFDEAQRVIQLLVNLCATSGYAQVAAAFEGHAAFARREYDTPVGAWGLHVTDCQAVQAVGGYDESLRIFHDWEMSARLICAGYKTCRCNLVAFRHKMKSMPGGAECVYQDGDAVKEAAEQVRAKYPWACKTKYVESHGLWEIRFNWKAL
jgi:hypothetical protein